MLKVKEKEEKKGEKEEKKEKKKEKEGEKEGEKEEVLMMINDFKKNGISVLNELDEDKITEMMKLANIKYRNSTPIMTDNQYDIIQDYITEKYPSNQAILEIGAAVERNKATLPYQMASMDKIKPDTTALETWTKKFTGPYVLSCKLDGVSALYTTEGPTPKLYTRGDGKVGQDVSHLIQFLRLPKTKDLVIRGEFIIPKKVFEYKYKDTFANPRNLVSGIVSHKHIDEKVKALSFVAYEVIKPVLKPSDQMSYLSKQDIECVLNKNVTSLTNTILSETLVDWRKNYIYEIDGVIVTYDKIYERKSGNPDHSFAFKMVLSDQIAEAKVVDVLWTPSKDGYLKPRVRIEPINLGGVRIEYATGFNGAFIKDNKVGIGAIIELIRSGDVIPHIRNVNVPAEEGKMPSVPYKWTTTNVDIMLEDVGSDETVKEKNIAGFFRGIGVEGLSSGNVARIIQAGFDSVPKIINMSINDLLTVEGFKIKMATKVHYGIKDGLNKASLVTIMSATNLFGRGFSEKRLELIMNEYPDVLLSGENLEEKIKKIANIKGMAEKTAEAFVDKINDFVSFMNTAGLENKLIPLNPLLQIDQIGQIEENKIINTTNSLHPLYNKTIVMTGFRDKELELNLKKIGAKSGSSVSKNTFVVIIKSNESDESGKVIDAKKIGVPIMTLDEFKSKFNI